MSDRKLLTILVLTVILAVLASLLCGCQQAANGQGMELSPTVAAVAPVVVRLFVPEPWKTIAWLVLTGAGGIVIGRKTK